MVEISFFYFLGQMAENMKDIGPKGNKKDGDASIALKDLSRLDFGKMVLEKNGIKKSPKNINFSKI